MAGSGSVSGIRAGKAYVELGVNDTALQAGLKATEKRLKAWGAAIAGVGASIAAAGTAITAPFTLAAEKFAEAGSALYDMSARTGMSVEALSQLSYAAEQTGSDLATVEGAVRRMQKTLTAAQMGVAGAEAAFAELGLSVADLARMNPEQQFQQIARTIGDIRDPTARAAAAMLVFGKSGTALLPMISELPALTREAREFGLVMSGEAAAAADALGDSTALLGRVIGSLVKTIGSAVAPAWTKWNLAMARNLATVKAWVAAHKDLVAQIYTVGFGLTAAGTAFVVVGTALAAAGIAAGGFATALGAIGTGLAAIVSWPAVIGAALAGLVGWFLQTTTVGQQALGWLGQQFAALKAQVLDFVGSIADAFKSGDIQLAATILWGGLKVEWLKGKSVLMAIWTEWGVATVNTIDDAATGIRSVIVDLWAGVKSAWIAATAGIEIITRSWISGLLDLLEPFGLALDVMFGRDISGAMARTRNALGNDAGTLVKAGLDLAATETQRSDDQATLEFGRKRRALRRGNAADRALAGATGELTQAQEDLQAYMSQARAATAAAGKGGALGKVPGLTPENLDAALGEAATKAKIDVQGTGNVLTAGRLAAGSSVEDDQLKEQKKMSKALESLDRKAGLGQLVFGQS